MLRALEILQEHRSPNTPVAIARQLSRPNEEIFIHTLANTPIDKVDMLSLILIGNSFSKLRDCFFLTPRGY